MQIKPDDFPTPGRYIRALLDERGWDQRTLARVLGLDYPATNRLSLDKKPITAFNAIMLGEAFNVEPSAFLSLQQKYDLAVALAASTPNNARKLRAKIYGGLPIAEIVRRGWLPGVNDPDDTEGVEVALARFFGVDSPENIPAIPLAAKKTNVYGEPTGAEKMWALVVRKIAATIEVPRYSPAAVREAIEQFKPLLRTRDGVVKVGPILSRAGIRFVVVESLPSARIDGVCTWLNDMAPVIGMSLRHDRLDNFWYVLRHECEHVLNGHGRQRQTDRVDVALDEQPQVGVPDEERIANAAASDFCVPGEQMDRFYSIKKPFFMKQDVLGFAKSVDRHPALVVGQLQRRAHRFDRFREFLLKVRELVVPGVAADGWGHVYPIPEPERSA